jgi:hypothetical protein
MSVNESVRFIFSFRLGSCCVESLRFCWNVYWNIVLGSYACSVAYTFMETVADLLLGCLLLGIVGCLFSLLEGPGGGLLALVVRCACFLLTFC